MKRSQALTALVFCFAAAGAGAAQGELSQNAVSSGPQIILPTDGDEYSALVARAAAQDQTLDFRALRLAYLKSAARKKATDDPRVLAAAMFAAAKEGNDQKVRDAAVKLLSVSYIDMYGHKFLRQACENLHDEVCAQQSHFVEFGLLKSIMASGDGKTCKTGWEAVTIGEEYFILNMTGMTMQSQALINGPPACDLLNAVDKTGKAQSYYFRIDAMMADEMSMFAH
ncbi:MAG: DUF4919 domain-containing protein [Rhizomicrobium sp.]